MAQKREGKEKKQNRSTKKEQEVANSRRPLKGSFTCAVMIITDAPPVPSPPPHPFISLCGGGRERGDLNALAACVFPMEDLQAVSGQEPFVWS